MTEAIIADDLRDFILRHVDSVAQLEALLLLRANPDSAWDAAEAAKRLYISEPAAAEVLAQLCADGLLGQNAGRYSYRDVTEEQRRMVDRLAEAYARHLIPVTNIIHAKPGRIRQFADAFKFRRDR